MEKPVIADTAASLWNIEVFTLPIQWIAKIPGNELDLVLQPYRIKKLGTGANSQMLQLWFQTNKREQASLLREQLLATGVVEQVTITKQTN